MESRPHVKRLAPPSRNRRGLAKSGYVVPCCAKWVLQSLTGHRTDRHSLVDPVTWGNLRVPHHVVKSSEPEAWNRRRSTQLAKRRRCFAR